MKTTTFIRSCVRFALLAAALSLANLATAQWVAFNDHVAGTGTHPNTTRFVCPGVGATGSSSGPLTNIDTGAQLPVTLTISVTGTTISGGTTCFPALPGTPAYNVFNGFVSFGESGGASGAGAAIQTRTGDVVTYTFTGLDVTKQYKFHGSAIRGGFGGGTSSYTNRWEVYAIVGAASFVNVPTPGCVTIVQEPGSIAANEVVFNAGTNTNAPPAAGEMAEWDNIVPGAGGTFSVTSTRYTGPLPAPNSSAISGTSPYSYAISGMRLEEVNVTPTCAAITQAPTNQTVVQCSSVTMHVSATGNPAPTNQWYKGSTAIPNATNANYTIPNAQTTDSGTYHVTVGNVGAGCTATNATNTLTVTPGPTFAVVRAVGSTNSTQILVSYSAPIDGNLVDQNGFAFHLSGGLNVQSAALDRSTNILLVTDAPRANSVVYCLTIDTNSEFSACGGAGAAATTVQLPVYLVRVTDGGWQYNQSGTDPGTNWTKPNFDDTVAPWQTGTSIFDAKNSGPRTMLGVYAVNTDLVLSNTASAFGNNDLPTYNFRKHFTFPTPTGGASLVMNAMIDDAAIFYINGQEAARVGGLTNGVAIPFDEYGGTNDNTHTWGSRTVGTPTNLSDVVTLPLTNVVEGDNVLAVELKQERATSSDITMGLELIVTLPPVLAIGRSGTNEVVSWCTGTLQASTNPAAFFSDVANAVSPVTVTNTGPRKFYRLR